MMHRPAWRIWAARIQSPTIPTVQVIVLRGSIAGAQGREDIVEIEGKTIQGRQWVDSGGKSAHGLVGGEPDAARRAAAEGGD